MQSESKSLSKQSPPKPLPPLHLEEEIDLENMDPVEIKEKL